MDVCLYVIGTYCGLCGGYSLQDKYGFWLQGYAMHACASEITIKAIAVASSAPFHHNLLLNEYLLSSLPDLSLYCSYFVLSRFV